MFKLSKEGIDFVRKEMSRYETKRSAIIPALYRVQEENKGWVSPECVTYLSELMEINESHIYEVLSFYTMFNKKDIGPLHIQVCSNVSCSMAGSRELLSSLKKTFEEEQSNQMCTFTSVECLGSCDTAPVVQINRDAYIENAELDHIKQVIETKIRIEKNSNSKV